MTRFALLAVLAAAVPAVGQEGPPARFSSSVRATAQATATAQPDRARIHIGVVTQAATAQEAGAQNARQLDAVLAELRKALGSAGEIKTLGYSLNPNYRYQKEGGPPAITGYAASNTVEITTDDLTKAGKAIDVAIGSGANNVQSLEYLLKNDRPLRIQALRDAATQARAEAEAMAAAMGLKVVRVLSVEEGEPASRPMLLQYMGAAQMSTPINPGAVEIHAVVTVTLAVK